MNPLLSVIIPSYNEMSNLRRGVLNDVLAYLQKQPYSWEIILTDDGSTDGTVEELRKFMKKHAAIHLLENHHAGKAPTVSAGMLAAHGQYRLFTDFDQSTPLSEVERALQYLKEGKDIVIGSREVQGAKRHEEPLHRHIMGRGFNLMVQILALPGIQDSQCGFKAFTAAATLKLFPSLYVYGGSHQRSDAFTGAFDVELLFLARKFGYKIQEMGVYWEHNQSDRVSPIKDSLRMFFDIVKIRFAWLSGRYHLSPAHQ